MRRLLNTLYVTTEDAYLALDGENIVVKCGEAVAARYPLHILESIVSFSYAGASPALMGKCAEAGIALSFCTPRGKFLASVRGKGGGNVLLRRAQYRVADDPAQSCRIARCSIFGKLYNCRWSIERTARDHSLRVDTEKLKNASSQLRELLPTVLDEWSLESLRGTEGAAATIYFSVLNEMILSNKEYFEFTGRSRRPPLDPINALLSFAYSLLAGNCASALESVGFDSYVGFMHSDRPGRESLALDLMEELRPCMADRFVLTMINNRIITPEHMIVSQSGAVRLNDAGRKLFLMHWQEKKKETITHPYLREKIQWGLVPYVQAQLLARYFRGDIEEYPPFLWK